VAAAAAAAVDSWRVEPAAVRHALIYDNSSPICLTDLCVRTLARVRKIKVIW